jgi:hypothetical protein
MKKSSIFWLLACMLFFLQQHPGSCIGSNSSNKRRRYKANNLRKAQVYGQSVINGDGTFGRSLAAVIRVPREQPDDLNDLEAPKLGPNEMPNDEPDTSSSSSGKILYSSMSHYINI